jgi:itaconyl-CoA hydratase
MKNSPMATTTFDPSNFPVMIKGHKFDEFTLGRKFVHHWGRTLSAADNVIFSTALCFWNPMYLNVEYARAHGHVDTVVNPMLVLCTAVGLSVEDLSEAGGPFLGIEACRFHVPVYPGDTVRAVSTVVATRESETRPNEGIVTWTTEVFNQDDVLVASYERTNLVAKRSST